MVILVKKKDGTRKLYIEYRELKLLTIKDDGFIQNEIVAILKHQLIDATWENLLGITTYVIAQIPAFTPLRQG